MLVARVERDDQQAMGDIMEAAAQFLQAKFLQVFIHLKDVDWNSHFGLQKSSFMKFLQTSMLSYFIFELAIQRMK
jgi:hypothetical protein